MQQAKTDDLTRLQCCEALDSDVNTGLVSFMRGDRHNGVKSRNDLDPMETRHRKRKMCVQIVTKRETHIPRHRRLKEIFSSASVLDQASCMLGWVGQCDPMVVVLPVGKI